MHKNHYGFSLIELMIVVTIIGILTTVALPSYLHYTERARFAEVIAATAPYKTAVALALQQGITEISINTGQSGIPPAPTATKNLASLLVKHGVITATATNLAGNATFILTPNSDGSRWTQSGTCETKGLCTS